MLSWKTQTPSSNLKISPRYHSRPKIHVMIWFKSSRNTSSHFRLWSNQSFIWNLKHILTSCLRSQQTIQTFVLNLKNNPSFVKSWSTPQVSQPHFGLSVRMRLTLSKVGTWSPLGLPKTQSSIARVKTPCIKVFFISMERSWSLDVKNGLAWSIWTSAAQVMGKRKAGSQIGNLTPDH